MQEKESFYTFLFVFTSIVLVIILMVFNNSFVDGVKSGLIEVAGKVYSCKEKVKN